MNQKFDLSAGFIHEAVDENGKVYRTHYQTIEIYNGENDIWLQLKERVSVFSQFDWHTMYEVCIDCVLKNIRDIRKIRELVEQSVDPAFNYGIIEIETPVKEGKYFNEKKNQEVSIDSLKFRADTRGLLVIPISEGKICHHSPGVSYSTKDTFYCDFLKDDRENYSKLLDFLNNIGRLLKIDMTIKEKIRPHSSPYSSKFENLKRYECGNEILVHLNDGIKCMEYRLFNPAINSFLHAIEWALIVKLKDVGRDVVKEERERRKKYYLKDLCDSAHKMGIISDKMYDRLLKFNESERRWTAHHKTGETTEDDAIYVMNLLQKLIEKLKL